MESRRCILSIVSFSQLLEPIFFTFNVTNNTLMHDFTVCGLFPVRVVDGGGGGYDNSCKSGKRSFQRRVHGSIDDQIKNQRRVGLKSPDYES